MIELHITRTGKSYSPKDEYRTFDFQRKSFPDVAAAKAWLKEEYGNCKRGFIYVDDQNGKAKKAGYIFGFRNSDLSHHPVEKWLQQDWVSFYEAKPLELGR